MLYDPAYAAEIKSWLASKLEPICDADPDVLADYVLALLKHDNDATKLEETLNEQLTDFLAENTSTFCQETVDMLQNKRYLPEGLASSSDQPMDTSSSGRKRGRSEEADGDVSMSKSMRADGAEGSGSRAQGGPGGDAWASRRTGAGMGNDGMPLMRMPPLNGRGGRLPEGMCRDFHVRGFCSRGDSCKFMHLTPDGQLPFMPPAPQPPSDARQVGGNTDGPGPGPMGPMPPMPPFGMPGMPPMPPGMDFNMFAAAAAAAGANGGPPGRGGGHMRGRGRGGMNGVFTSKRRSATTLVIEHIPPENLDLMQVNERFKRFGTITNIQIDKRNGKALVSYSTPDEAHRAHSDPDVIFGSRFVKVYFQALDEPAGDSANGASAGESARGGHSGPMRGGRGGHHAPRGPVVTDADIKMFAADARAKQAALDSMLEEQKMLMSGISALEGESKQKAMSRLRELAATIPAATQQAKEAAEKVQSSSTAAVTPIPESSKAILEKAKRKQLDRELDAISAAGGAGMAVDGEEGATGTDGATTEELKAKLASLKAEAAARGIDPSAAAPAGGFGRGRGRGFARGGSFRGGRGGFQRGFANLDLRPKTLLIDMQTDGGEAIEGEKREKVEGWLKNFGEIENISDGDADTAGKLVVKWKNRHEGDKAVWSGGDVPDVGKLKMAWAAAPAAAPAPAAAVEAQTQGEAGAAME